VSKWLKDAFAEETRSALISHPLPGDARRVQAALQSELATLDRGSKIETRTRAALSASEARVPSAPSIETPSSQPDSVLARLRQLLGRWLNNDQAASVASINDLDAFIATSEATAETLLEEAGALEARLHETRTDLDTLRTDRDGLDLELTDVQDEASTLRRRVEYLQSKLTDAGEFGAAYSEPEVDAQWQAPASAIELATLLTGGSEKPHLAFDRVEFTGDLADVEELHKRDSIGRYSNALWEYVQVLYDYVGQRRDGYAGSVHMYLTDDKRPGRKCSPQRHAAGESEAVQNNVAWAAERNLPVPTSVDASGHIPMKAHFKPTHKDTFAPRMHYYDDTANSGKVYIGYIGRHLTNTKTSNS